MFTDISLSDDLNREFQQFLSRNRITLPSEFMSIRIILANMSANILTSGSWPLNSSQTSKFILPSQLQQCIDKFTIMYNSRHNGRKLEWQYSLCKGTWIAFNLVVIEQVKWNSLDLTRNMMLQCHCLTWQYCFILINVILPLCVNWEMLLDWAWMI